MYLIRQLASKYKITRTTLLHYDSIGLLQPSSRSESGYRLYSKDDEERLKGILAFRSMGLSLKSIQEIFSSETIKSVNILLSQLEKLSDEIEELKIKQRNIIREFLRAESINDLFENGDDVFKDLMLYSGFHPNRFHQKMEKSSPENHLYLLDTAKKIPEGNNPTFVSLLKELQLGKKA